MLAPTVQHLDPGIDRYGFVLVGADHRLVEAATAAIYFEHAGARKASGPYVAAAESLGVASSFESRTVRGGPPPPQSLHVARLPLLTPGVYSMLAVVTINGRVEATSPVRAPVVAADPVPRVGQKAPLIQTPTAASVGGNLAAIDTRQPPDDMHQVNYADAYGKRPILLVFAAPGLCQTRICRPAVDIVMEVEHEHPREAVFIHSEIYQGDEIKPGCLEGTRRVAECYRPQFLAFHLDTAPWVFAIDRHGDVAARLEGPFSKGELEGALARAVTR